MGYKRSNHLFSMFCTPSEFQGFLRDVPSVDCTLPHDVDPDQWAYGRRSHQAKEALAHTLVTFYDYICTFSKSPTYSQSFETSAFSAIAAELYTSRRSR